MDALEHKPSNLLKELLSQIDRADAIHALSYQSAALLIDYARKNSEYMIRFTRLGEIGREYRPAMGTVEFSKHVPLLLSATITAPICFVSASLDAFLYDIGNLIYKHQGNEIPLKADVSWYRLDMVEFVTGVDPKMCVGYAGVKTLQNLMDSVRYPWVASNTVPFEMYEVMVKDLRMFAIDFETAVQQSWPKLRLEGAE